MSALRFARAATFAALIAVFAFATGCNGDNTGANHTSGVANAPPATAVNPRTFDNEVDDPTEDPKITKEAIDEVNEDSTPNPNPNQSNVESPYPNDAFNSSIGLGGNIGGGSGMQYRRARGGAGAGASEHVYIPRDGRLAPAQHLGVDVTTGKLLACSVGKDGGAANAAPKVIGEFPLKHTNVAAEISGMIASTIVTQTFTNDFDTIIEAVYVFPLPNDAAVNDFVMTIGEREIVGHIRERAQAEREYEEAKARGYRAALLTQERPNVFTQNIANIEPGGSLDVSIRYISQLTYEAGEYMFHFPMVVAPRYFPAPAAEIGDVAPGNGDRAQASETEPVRPPYAPEDTRAGHDIALRVNLDAGVPITDLTSELHAVDVDRLGPSRAVVTLRNEDSIPNRDFVLRYRVDGDLPQAALLTHAEAGKRGTFMLMVQPPEAPADELVMARELIFVLDSSGSMRGQPLAQSVALMDLCLDNLRPDDAFNVITFAGNSSILNRDGALTVTPENVVRAREFIHSLQGGGGTEFLSSMQMLATQPRENGRMRIVVFLTDGLVGNEEQIIAFIRESQESDVMARFFAMGVGNSVNRYLLDSIGSVGNGATEYVTLATEPEVAAGHFYRRIDAPMMFNIELDWGGLPVVDTYPARLPDLFAGQPLRLIGRYVGGGSGTLTIRAWRGSERIEMEVKVDLPAVEEDNAALASVWARQQINGLSLQLGGDRDDVIVDQIRALALEYGLMSQYTAFLAVDSSEVVGDGNPNRVDQPAEFPDGMDREGTLGPDR